MADLLLRMPVSSRKWRIAPETLQWPWSSAHRKADGCSGWLRAVPWDLCSPMNYVQFLYVFLICILQCLCCNFTQVRTTETFLPMAHTCAKKQVFLPPVCVYMFMHLFYSKL